MKTGLEKLMGKTIVSVVANPKRNQVFLVFSDETHFEFYAGEHMNWTADVDKGGLDRVLKYISHTSDENTTVFK